MLIDNRSGYATDPVERLLRYALLETVHDMLTVEVGDLTEEGSPAQVEIELSPRVRAGATGPRLLLWLAPPTAFPALVTPAQLAVADWAEAVVACSAFAGRALWRTQRYPEPGSESEAQQDMTQFAGWKLMSFRKLREHARQWGWVPVELQSRCKHHSDQ